MEPKQEEGDKRIALRDDSPSSEVECELSSRSDRGSELSTSRNESVTKSVTVRGTRESAREIIKNKREIFYLQYTLQTKKDAVERLDNEKENLTNKITEKEENLRAAEEDLERKIRESEQRATKTMQKLEAMTKQRIEKAAEIKRQKHELTILTDKEKQLEEKLAFCRRCKDFLDSISPKEYLEKRAGSEAEGKEYETYFTTPQQILAVISRMEERNIQLLEKNTEIQEILKDLKKSRLNKAKLLDDQLTALDENIVDVDWDLSKAVALKEERNPNEKSDCEEEFQKLKGGIKRVLIDVGMNQDVSSDPIEMISCLEIKMIDLLNDVSKLPMEKVKQAERKKICELRTRQRKKRIEEQQKQAEERRRKTLERANAPIPKAKRIMFRSHIPEKKKRRNKAAEEENCTFFVDSDE